MLSDGMATKTITYPLDWIQTIMQITVKIIKTAVKTIVKRASKGAHKFRKDTAYDRSVRTALLLRRDWMLLKLEVIIVNLELISSFHMLKGVDLPFGFKALEFKAEPLRMVVDVKQSFRMGFNLNHSSFHRLNFVLYCCGLIWLNLLI